MTFDEAIERLGIADYRDRILYSNTHGELMHLRDYIAIAQIFEEDSTWFREWFELTVGFAEKEWARPESVFQHIPTLLDDFLEDVDGQIEQQIEVN